MRKIFLLVLILLLSSLYIYAAEVEIKPLRAVVSGKDIIREDGQKLKMRGFVLSNFANGDWKGNIQIRPDRIPDWVLTRKDIKQLKKMGVTFVRYAMNFDIFEPKNRKDGFRDLSERLRWFGEEGIYVVINLHITKGKSSAFKSKGKTIFEDEYLWKDFEEFWIRLLRKYKYNSTILGWEFFNEPKIPAYGREKYKQVINNFVKKMRRFDPYHVFVIPNAESARNPDGSDNWDFQPFFKINDDNIIYTFHYYEPKDFTHQKFWLSIPANGMKYPFLKFDNAKYLSFSTPMQYKEEERPKASAKGGSASGGKKGWKWTVSKYFTPPKEATYGVLSFVAGNETGTIYYDDPKLIEISPDGKRKEIELPNPSFKPYAWDFVNPAEFSPDDYYGLTYFVADRPHENVKFLKNVAKKDFKKDNVIVQIGYPGFDDDYCLKVTNPYTGVTNISFDPRVFPVFPKKGYQYQIKCLIKKENSKSYDPKKGNWNNIDMAWFKADKTIIDKKYMKKDIISKYVDWGKKNKVPLFCGEFGTDNFIYNPYRVAWAKDILEILNELEIPWTYWDYKGIYGWGFSFCVIANRTDHREVELFTNEKLLNVIKDALLTP